MASYSLSELLTWMEGKSKTFGWDAVISYDQNKINMLMEQQYVTKVGAGEVLPPISDRTGDSGSTNVITDMVLGTPLMSFESANLSDSTANLTMPFLAGSFTTEIMSTGVPGHIDKMSTVVPGCGYVLTMSLNLLGSTGQISETGEVYLDLGTGVNFTVNFVDDPEDQQAIGNKFKALYEAASPEQKRYVLGMLDPGGNYALTPEKFYIRTQPAPGATLRDSATYGMGAIVLFVRTKASSGLADGLFPSSDYIYLIPNDVDGDGNPLYSGTVLIASKTLFEDIIAPEYARLVGGGLTFTVNNADSTELACSLSATAGNFAAGIVDVNETYYPPPNYWKVYNRAYSGTSTDGPESLQLPCAGMSIISEANNVVSNWDKSYSAPFRDYTKIQNDPPSNFQRDVGINFGAGASSTVTVDGGNVVRFVPVGTPDAAVSISQDWMSGSLSAETVSQISDRVRNAVNTFNNFQVPGIDLFTLSNLLFPEDNALQLSSANIPGDLACFGQLAPERSSFKISPLQDVVVAGKTLQFKVDSADYAGQPVTWSVQATGGALPGTIDANGLYQAPASVPGEMASAAHQDIVTASIGTGDELKQASAVAVVVNHAITVNPAFKLFSPTEGSVALSAVAQSADVSWELISGNGTLSSLSGSATSFTPVIPTEIPAEVSIVEARDVEYGDTYRSAILTLKSDLVLSLEVTPLSMPAIGVSETQQLTALYAGAPTVVTWKVLSGGGTITADGLYTAPAVIEDSCAVIWAEIYVNSTVQLYGYGVIPLKR